MRIAVLGAAGGVGQQVVTVAADAGHAVVAGARSPVPERPGVAVRSVDVCDAAAVASAVDGCDAVLWCVGVTRRSGPDVGRTGMRHLVAALQARDCRVVSISGAGVTLPGDDKGTGARVASLLTRTFARDLVLDKQGEHAVLADSELPWTEVRAPRLVDGTAGGRWELTTRAPGLSARPVTRADVAAAMLELATAREWLRRSPFLVAG